TNLLAVWDDDIFRRALANTFIFTLTSQALQMILGTGLAFLLLKQFRGRRLVRGLLMIPFTIPIAIGAMAWTWMLNPTYSVINWIGVHAGLFTQGPNWLGETHVIASYAFQTGIVAGSLGRRATMSLFLFPVLLVGALLLLRNLKARTID